MTRLPNWSTQTSCLIHSDAPALTSHTPEPRSEMKHSRRIDIAASLTLSSVGHGRACSPRACVAFTGSLAGDTPRIAFLG